MDLNKIPNVSIRGCPFWRDCPFFRAHKTTSRTRAVKLDGTAGTSSLVSTFSAISATLFQALKLSSDDYGRDSCCHGLHPCYCTFLRLGGSNQRRIFMQMLRSTFFRLRSPWTHVLSAWFSTATTTIGFFNCSRAQAV